MTQSDSHTRLPQLRLPFPDTVQSFDDLAVTDANRNAIETIRKWSEWKSQLLCLIGPVQSGLGIAAQLWAKEAGAKLFSARDIDNMSEAALEDAARSNCVVDLADQVKSDDHLLALINFCEAKNTRLLLTARSAGAHWPVSSPDLKSRLTTMAVAEIYPPDEEMIAERLHASCKRRYIKLSNATVDYLVVRLPRSYEAIEDYVLRLDKEISETGRAPSIHLARSVLEDGASTRKLFDNDEL